MASATISCLLLFFMQASCSTDCYAGDASETYQDVTGLLQSKIQAENVGEEENDGQMRAVAPIHWKDASHAATEESFPSDRTPASHFPVPQFELVDRMGKSIQSSAYEFDEQDQLVSLLRDGDRVLQLGGNIGTTCIAVAKSRRLAAHLCVEPNQLNVAVLKQNLISNNVSDNVSILEGIVADSCDNLYMHNTDNAVNNDWANHPVQDTQGAGQKVDCTGLKLLQAKHGTFNVVLADCEGCFPQFLQDNFALLQNVQVVVLELDGVANYDSNFMSLLEKLGLRCPNNYKDTKYGGLKRAACWRTTRVSPHWDHVPSFADGPKWGAEYEAAVNAMR